MINLVTAKNILKEKKKVALMTDFEYFVGVSEKRGLKKVAFLWGRRKR